MSMGGWGKEWLIIGSKTMADYQVIGDLSQKGGNEEQDERDR